MLFKVAFRIIAYEKEKFSGAVAGVALAIFLMILQWGFYLGYRRDITIVPDSIDADIWFVPRNQPMFDGWMAMDDLPYFQAKGHRDIGAAARLVWGYASFRIPQTGGKDTVEVLGFELDSGVRLTFDLDNAALPGLLHPDGHILVGWKDREKLGIDTLGGDGIEILGRRARAVGFVDNVHLFTTAGFVLTDLDNGRAFLKTPQSRASYIVCKCRRGADVGAVVRDLQASFPEHEVMTSRQFHDRAAEYWASRTGVGPVLLQSAVLSVAVGFLIVMLAFYISTIEKIPIFACMKALGASSWEVASILISQVIIVFVIGCLLAGGALWVAVSILAGTTISVVITPGLVILGLGTTAVCSALSSLLSFRKLMSTDPGEAFRT